MRGWGAEEIFRPIAFAWLEWIRRLGPYVILEEHGPGINNIHINTMKRLGPYVINTRGTWARNIPFSTSNRKAFLSETGIRGI